MTIQKQLKPAGELAKKNGVRFPNESNEYRLARARMLLEERGVLPHREKHKNGAEWLFWAEEANSSASR